ncbi:MAG TPA: type II secretion system protein [Pontiella sp.]
MKRKQPESPDQHSRSVGEKLTTSNGFTLLEVIIAMVIMTISLSIAFQAYNGTMRGWKRGTEILDGIKHADFAMTQLVSALNSTIYFNNPRKVYAFILEKDTIDGLPADTVSFVTASGAFLPPSSPFSSGPHRLKVFIDDDDGDPALFVMAMPAVASSNEDEEFEDDYDAEPLLATRGIQGMEILIWDEENEDWTDEWEEKNSIPERILITLYSASNDEYEDPIEFQRMLEIPVFMSVKDNLSGPSMKGGSSSEGRGGAQKAIHLKL